jgi:amidophosphoribosyltransferase
MFEKCGVFGIWSDKEDVASDAYFALLQMQHRGKESAGIVSSHENKLYAHLGMGTVDQAFREEIPEDKLVKSILEHHSNGESQKNIVAFLQENKFKMQESVLEKLKGKIAIGHVRYSTTGASIAANIQPMLGWFKEKQFAVAHNGNLVGILPLREECGRKGYKFKTTTDTEVIVALLATSAKNNFADAVAEALPRLKGAFSLTIIFDEMVIAARDAHGIRPLCWGKRGGDYIVASESRVLDVLGGELIDDVAPGEMIIFRDGEEKRIIWAANPSLNGLCLFEFIYFANPDSIIQGQTIYLVREEMGKLLAGEHPAPLADLVISIPDSANPAAFGYGLGSGIPVCTYGLFRSHTVGRTFMEPAVEKRKKFQRLKHNPIPAKIRGLRLVVVDDSIVRAMTLPKVIQFLAAAGVKAIDIRISSPPLLHPCHLGIDTKTYEELIRTKHKTNEEMVEFLKKETSFEGEITLGHLSLESTIKAAGLPKESFCLGSFTGHYPVNRK